MRGGYNFDNLTGRRFSRLLVLGRQICDEYTNVSYWRVRCDCGVEFITARPNLISGKTRSCGCLRGELLAERNRRRKEL